MMNKRLYKTYVNLTNIVVRLSDGTPEGKQHAVLVNAHLDSTLPSPGAADDAVCVGIMLECIRVLINTPAWSPKHAIVFRESLRHIFDVVVSQCQSFQSCGGITSRWFPPLFDTASHRCNVSPEPSFFFQLLIDV
jgi:Zn-dependent M28 family amino/carboxypeptidase